MWVGLLVALVDELSGGTTTAPVTHIYTQEVYTIRFTTADGTSCVTPHKWDGRAEPVKLNDTFAVHYSRASPCDNVERADDSFSRYVGISVATIFLAIGGAAIRRLRQRGRIVA